MSLFGNLLKSLRQTRGIESNVEKPSRITMFLGDKETSEIRKLTRSEARDFATKVMVDFVNNTLTIQLGTKDLITVPFKTFYSEEPDFARVSLADDGRTIKFGNFRATVDSIVHEWALLEAAKTSSRSPNSTRQG